MSWQHTWLFEGTAFLSNAGPGRPCAPCKNVFRATGLGRKAEADEAAPALVSGLMLPNVCRPPLRRAAVAAPAIVDTERNEKSLVALECLYLSFIDSQNLELGGAPLQSLAVKTKQQTKCCFNSKFNGFGLPNVILNGGGWKKQRNSRRFQPFITPVLNPCASCDIL